MLLHHNITSSTTCSRHFRRHPTTWPTSRYPAGAVPEPPGNTQSAPATGNISGTSASAPTMVVLIITVIFI
ncbi:hypothetical protein EJ08DRAFT_695264 [Tothia fuscella]|uniref:Uncharacterized protein n=1 Tax=Tothia fuscella TaxID=1048955 RepID=A0A9P4NVH8_9PEZI|nr:hypothetical protein EJ08DRAFT_695264 [Tothia fuscella]